MVQGVRGLSGRLLLRRCIPILDWLLLCQQVRGVHHRQMGCLVTARSHNGHINISLGKNGKLLLLLPVGAALRRYIASNFLRIEWLVWLARTLRCMPIYSAVRGGKFLLLQLVSVYGGCLPVCVDALSLWI